MGSLDATAAVGTAPRVVDYVDDPPRVVDFVDAQVTAREPSRHTARDDARYRRALAITDLVSAAGAMVMVRVAFGGPLLRWDLLASGLIVILAKLMMLYDGDRVTIRRSTLDEAPRLIMLAAVWAVVWSLITIPVHLKSGHSGSTGLLWLLVCALMISTRGSVRAVAKRLSGPERLLIVGESCARETLAFSLSTDPGAHVEVVGYLPLEDERRGDSGPPAHLQADRRRRNLSFADLPVVVRNLGVDRILLLPSSSDSDQTLDAVRRATELGISVSLLPRLFEVVGSAVEFDSVGGVTVLGLRQPGLGPSSRLIKRSMDLAGAGLITALLSPLFLVVAVAIKLDSRGPVFFRQRRVGRGGEIFEILKFRSMIDGAEAQRAELEHLNETDGLFKLASDPRITRVGGLLRRFSIDELPQLLNVLRGDMSLVGPRPLVLAEDALVVGRHRERFTFAPGMTGPWQVLGPTRPPLAEMVKTDYLYAITWNIWLDIKILLRTAAHITSGRGR